MWQTGNNIEPSALLATIFDWAVQEKHFHLLLKGNSKTIVNESRLVHYITTRWLVRLAGQNCKNRNSRKYEDSCFKKQFIGRKCSS